MQKKYVEPEMKIKKLLSSESISASDRNPLSEDGDGYKNEWFN